MSRQGGRCSEGSGGRRASAAPVVLRAHGKPLTHLCRTDEHVGTPSRHRCLLSAALWGQKTRCASCRL